MNKSFEQVGISNYWNFNGGQIKVIVTFQHNWKTQDFGVILFSFCCKDNDKGSDFL